MARFYADIVSDNGRTTTSRIGRNDISSHPRGWNVGVLVHLWPVAANSDANNVSVTLTGGSSNQNKDVHLVQVTEKDGERMLVIFNPETREVLWEGEV